MNNSTMIRYILLLILLLEIDVTVYGETKRPLLYETKHKFDHKGQNLKGNVFSVVTKKVKHRQEFGQDRVIGEFTIDSIVFDENSRIACHYYNGCGKYLTKFEKYLYDDNDVIKINGEVHDYDRIIEITNDTIRYNRIFDNKGRLTQESTFKVRQPISQVNFTYTTSGYIVTYYPSLEADAETYEVNNSVVKFYSYSISNKKYPDQTLYLNKNEQEAKIVLYPKMFLSNKPYGTKSYSYNTNGDVIKEEMVYLSNNRKNTTTYTYKYDDQGNWISRTCKNGDGIEWLKREIIYMTPEEIIQYNKLEKQNRINFEENLLKKAKNYALRFNNEMTPKYINELIKWKRDVSALNKKIIPVENALNFQVKDDLYSFTFSDGSKSIV